MEYITIVSDSYEKALEEARRKYGSALRVHSRREYTVGGGLFAKKRKKCELTCYLSSTKTSEETVTRQDLAEFEKEARTPDPETLSAKDKLDTMRPAKELEDSRRIEEILDMNEIRGRLREHVLENFDGGDDLMLSLGDKIISSVGIDHENQAHPKKYQIFLGSTGSGKTTTLAKIACLYQVAGHDVAILSLDSYRIGAFEQIKAFADAFNIPSALVRDEGDVIPSLDLFRNKDIVFVDTMGLSLNDRALNLKLRGLISLFDRKNTGSMLICPANVKAQDLMKQFRHYVQFVSIDSLIVTKLDESESVGSFLTFAYESGLPVSFCTNGQGVPDDLKKASTLVLMEYLKGFDMGLRPVIGQLT